MTGTIFDFVYEEPKTTGTIFDHVEENVSEEEKRDREISKNAPMPKDTSFLNTIKDYGKTALKGTIEGVSKLGRMMGPLQDESGKTTEQQLQEQTEVLDKLLPTDEGFIQKGLRRGLKEAPSVMSFPGSAVQAGTRSIAAGYAGETAKEYGLPEWAQSAAEITAFIGPDLTKKLLSSGKNKELIEFAKKMGFSDAEITPLIQSEFKQKWLSKLSPKRGSTQKRLQDTKNRLEQTYGSLQKSKDAGLEISEKANGTMINELFEKLNEMPREVRGAIEADLNDLLNNKITGKSLINFYKDINAKFSGNTKQLSLLKEPIKKALSSISPSLSQDFEMVNKLYTKYYPIAGRLKPNLVSDLISAGESIGIVASLTTGQMEYLYGLVGDKAVRQLSKHLLMNPHLQQLSKKMAVAINQNKYALAKQVTQEFKTRIKKHSPEIAEKIHTLTPEEFEKLLINYQSEKEE